MNIKLEEYIRGSRVRLTVDDAPMTALRSLVSAFVTACDTVEEHYEPKGAIGLGAMHLRDAYADTTTYKVPEYDMSRTEAQHEINRQRSAFVEAMAAAESLAVQEEDKLVAAVLGGAEIFAWGEPTVEIDGVVQPKRKRRPKAEMAADAAAQQEAPPLGSSGLHSTPASDAPLSAATDDTTGMTSSVTSSEPIAEEPALPFDAGSMEAEKPATVEEPSAAPTPADTEEVTDTELQRYCGRLAQHFGNAQKVFDLSKDFVPADAVARPTNIKDNAQRWAFIRHAEEASGVKYHG